MSTLRFWQRLDRHAGAIALIDADSGNSIRYSELAALVCSACDGFLPDRKRLAFLATEPSADSIIAYLGLLTAGHAVYLCGPRIVPDLVSRYEPDIIAWPSDRTTPPTLGSYHEGKPVAGHKILLRRSDSQHIDPDLTVLLTTSGSTASPKLVCLSQENISVAASQVCSALRLRADERTACSLPFEYVYGLSVIHSHLLAGASIVLSRRRLMEKSFWDAMLRNDVTSLAGVPWTYKLMRDTGMGPSTLRSIRKLTQSGAKLDAATRAWLLATFPPDLVDIFFMYGQTEAAGRITVLPPEFARDKRESVGLPVAGGRVTIEDGEVIFHGPNVMLGYAEKRSDLRKPDRMGGRLATGDMGEIDRDGCLYLTGRRNRIFKVLGNRISLDEVEEVLACRGLVAAIGQDECITIWYERKCMASFSGHEAEIAGILSLPRDRIRLRCLEYLPRNLTGKIAYGELPA